MFKSYYFNNSVDSHGRHEVHAEDCSYLPSLQNRTYIGFYSNCKEAIEAAKKQHPYEYFDGCFWCSNSCHKG